MENVQAPLKFKKEKSEDDVIIYNGFQAFKTITHSRKCIVPNILGNDTGVWGTYSNLYIGRFPPIFEYL